MASELKEQGNKALKAGNFDQAISCYTQAVALDPSSHILFSNRSAAYAQKKDYENALKDACQIIKVKPEWWKGYSRKAVALEFLGRLEDARVRLTQPKLSWLAGTELKEEKK